MKLINFKYWLQGWLEIENPEVASAKMVKEIKKHIEIVNEKDYFMGWLSGFLEGKKVIKKTEMPILKEKLQDQFIDITSENLLTSLKRTTEKPFPSLDDTFLKQVEKQRRIWDERTNPTLDFQCCSSKVPDVSKAVIC